MQYWLMRKEEVLAALEIGENGSILKTSEEVRNAELLPLAYRSDRRTGLKRWWNERSIPLGQGRVKEMLEEKGLVEPSEYLLRNLGLSLTDYYWIKPVASDLTWKDVNLFDNAFRENLLVRMKTASDGSFTPNSTLQGQLEKSWQIKEGKRILVKGNSDRYSTESLNELFACMLHKQQGFENYTEYKLLRIKNKPYRYCCYSELFTSQSRELVSAWAILTSDKGPSGQSDYEKLIAFCAEHGADPKMIRRDLDYMLMTDYILSNRDRHMNNIGILRNADDLRVLQIAPLYDTGKSMFTGQILPLRYADLVDGDIRSFSKNEKKQLAFVQDKGLVDTGRLPDGEQLFRLYRKDPALTTERIEQVCEAYEKKVAAFRQWQETK